MAAHDQHQTAQRVVQLDMTTALGSTARACREQDHEPDAVTALRAIGVEPVDIIDAYREAGIGYRRIAELDALYEELVQVRNEELALEALAKLGDG